jgi:chromosomal replication initiator protein
VNAKQIWQAALADLQTQTSRTSFETWLRNVSAHSFEGDTFVLAAPSSFARDWLESRLIGELRESIARVVGRPVRVEIVVGDAPSPSRPRRQRAAVDLPEIAPFSAASDRAASGAEDEANDAPEPAARTVDDWRPNPRYTFETFVVGSSNQLAHAAALAVAESPGSAYNPLFVYGGVGLGKTHLFHAIAHVVQAAGRRALYVTSETFTNEMIAAIRERRNEEFRARYRRTDVLLVDDVQFIAGKESTQEEFFHTFNALHGAGRQVVLCSDKPPRAIPTLEERLRSRFEWGLIADIQPPDLETRTAILQKKSIEQKVAVPPEVIAFLAQRIQSNIRELEGSLNRVVAYARLTGRTLNVDAAQAALADLLASQARRHLSPAEVVGAVCRFYRVDPRAIRGKARDREVVVPRQVAMYLCREDTDASLVEVGRELGGRDHSTVLHGANKIQAEVETSAQLRKEVLTIRELLYATARA